MTSKLDPPTTTTADNVVDVSTSTATKTTPEPLAALITGCSEPASLGAHLALDLKQRGYKVYATARKIETLKGLQKAGCEALTLDVTDKLSIEAAKAVVLEKDGRLDVLVNNAGVACSVPLLDTDLNKMRELYEVNVFGPLAVAQAFAPLLIEGHKLTGRQSVIVNIGSAALQSISDAMRCELAPLGIAVITVELSVVATPMSKGDKVMPLASATLTGYYPNYAEIQAGFTEIMRRDGEDGPTVDAVARSLANSITASSPPPKVWLGGRSYAWRWIIPLLPIRIVDILFSRQQQVALVPKL